MMMNDSDRVALVTGASRRIGADIVRHLHQAGYRVVLHFNRSADEAEALAARLNAVRADSVKILQADLGEHGAMDAVVAQSLGFWGRLDALVNNASAFYPTPMGRVTERQWDELMGSNLKAPFFLAQAAAESLARQQGAIVNIVDVYAERPLKSYPVYSVAKAGLAALTRSLAVELAPNVRVNGVSPGAILWPENEADDSKEALLARVPLGRCGAPEDIARAVVFLLRDAPYVTGQILAVDGGRSLFI
jgi:pteridine reductase